MDKSFQGQRKECNTENVNIKTIDFVDMAIE